MYECVPYTHLVTQWCGRLKTNDPVPGRGWCATWHERYVSRSAQWDSAAKIHGTTTKHPYDSASSLVFLCAKSGPSTNMDLPKIEPTAFEILRSISIYWPRNPPLNPPKSSQDFAANSTPELRTLRVLRLRCLGFFRRDQLGTSTGAFWWHLILTGSFANTWKAKCYHLECYNVWWNNGPVPIASPPSRMILTNWNVQLQIDLIWFDCFCGNPGSVMADRTGGGICRSFGIVFHILPCLGWVLFTRMRANVAGVEFTNVTHYHRLYIVFLSQVRDLGHHAPEKTLWVLHNVPSSSTSGHASILFVPRTRHQKRAKL